MLKKSIRRYTLLTSFLIHFQALAYLAILGLLNMLSTCGAPPEQLLEDDPIVFELQSPPEQRNRPREVIATPDDAKNEPPENPDFLSDKMAQARNEETDASMPIGDAFARGDYNVHELPVNQVPPGQQPQQPVEQQAEATELDDSPTPDPSKYAATGRSPVFRRELLVRASVPAGAEEQKKRIRHDNQKSRAPDMGALSFNTYEWDFAPYMLELKRKVEGNIFPPPAFTRLGLISGETRLRFKIYPGGEVRDLEVLDFQGHKTLMETSYRAIEVSGPFPNLPSDFPEEYLEVTAKFTYNADRQR